MNTTLYSTGPSCQRCNTTERYFTKAETPYEKVIITDAGELPQDVQDLKARGAWMSAPYVITRDSTGEILEDLSWSHFRPDKIKTLTDTMKQALVTN